MSRSPRESSCCAVPDCGIQVPPPHAWLYEETESEVGPVSELFAGAVQSTWNRKYCSEVDVPSVTMKFGSPDGGSLVPSSEAGSTVCSPLENAMKHCCVAACPASIFARS